MRKHTDPFLFGHCSMTSCIHEHMQMLGIWPMKLCHLGTCCTHTCAIPSHLLHYSRSNPRSQNVLCVGHTPMSDICIYIMSSEFSCFRTHGISDWMLPLNSKTFTQINIKCIYNVCVSSNLCFHTVSNTDPHSWLSAT